MLGFLGLLGALWTAAPCETGFCSCAVPDDVRTELEMSDAVFTGRVVAVRDTTAEEGTFPGPRVRRVTLRVDRAWKGVDSGTVDVVTGMGDADCGFPFRRGRSYLVFANRRPAGPLIAGLCGHTARLSRAAAALRALGPPARRWPR